MMAFLRNGHFSHEGLDSRVPEEPNKSEPSPYTDDPRLPLIPEFAFDARPVDGRDVVIGEIEVSYRQVPLESILPR